MGDTPPPPYPAQGDPQYSEKTQGPPAHNPYYQPPAQPVQQPGQPYQGPPPQPYGAPPPGYAQPPQAQPGYPQQPHAQPSYIQPPPGQPGYVQPQYGQQPGYMPPPPGQPHAQYQQAGTTVIISQPGRPSYGPSPCSIKCPQCAADITTTTKLSVGTMAWMVAGIICLVGCFFPCLWLGCCLIPICIPSLHDVTHSCPNCNTTLGHFKRAF